MRATGIWRGLTLGLAAAAVLLVARFRRRVRAEAGAVGSAGAVGPAGAPAMEPVSEGG